MATERAHTLPIGFKIQEYRIEKVIGAGGFGVTYLATDLNLDTQVALKEYFPGEFADRKQMDVCPFNADSEELYHWGLKSFLQEAKTLARFNHPNLVQVLRFFEGHNTAYMVMRYEEGMSLDRLIAAEHITAQNRVPETRLLTWILPLLDGLHKVHQASFLHRDIKPANIFIRRADHSPVLLDFGSARMTTGSHSRALTSLVSSGYSPYEQYSAESIQLPATDLYAFAATCYRLIAGKIPNDSATRLYAVINRQGDPLPHAVTIGAGDYSEALLKAIDRAMSLEMANRPQSVPEFRAELLGHTWQGATDSPSPTGIPTQAGAYPAGADASLTLRDPLPEAASTMVAPASEDTASPAATITTTTPAPEDISSAETMPPAIDQQQAQAEPRPPSPPEAPPIPEEPATGPEQHHPAPLGPSSPEETAIPVEPVTDPDNAAGKSIDQALKRRRPSDDELEESSRMFNLRMNSPLYTSSSSPPQKPAPAEPLAPAPREPPPPQASQADSSLDVAPTTSWNINGRSLLKHSGGIAAILILLVSLGFLQGRGLLFTTLIASIFGIVIYFVVKVLIGLLSD